MNVYLGVFIEKYKNLIISKTIPIIAWLPYYSKLKWSKYKKFVFKGNGKTFYKWWIWKVRINIKNVIKRKKLIIHLKKDINKKKISIKML